MDLKTGWKIKMKFSKIGKPKFAKMGNNISRAASQNAKTKLTQTLQEIQKTVSLHSSSPRSSRKTDSGFLVGLARGARVVGNIYQFGGRYKTVSIRHYLFSTFLENG